MSFSRTNNRTSRYDALTILASADPGRVKALADAALPALGEVTVLRSRTALVMLPCRDSALGAVFHLGEALVAEAHVRLTSHQAEGYGAVLGRDVEHAMALAVLDAAEEAGATTPQTAVFLREEAARREQAETTRMRKIAATRVEMETF